MAAPGLRQVLPHASSALADLLDGATGPLLPPVRSEIFGLQRFALHGQSLALAQRAAPSTWRSPTFFPRLRSNIAKLRQAYLYIGTQAATGYDISPAAEWLLENFHLIEAQLQQVQDGLPLVYFRTLPVLQEEPLAGLPRIYAIAWAFVAHTDGAFDDDLLMAFLRAYQDAGDLHLSEMWALPTTLRVVLIENLRRLAERVATNKAAREVANLCCDAPSECNVAMLDEVLGMLVPRGVGPVFLAQMALRLRDRAMRMHSAGDTQSSDPRLAWLSSHLPDAAGAQALQIAQQAADNLSVSNSVRSLRAISDADWPDIVARSSALMRLMLTSALFEAEAVGTRDQTLHGIEQLARHSGLGELVVAKALLDHMHGSTEADGHDAVAGYWLLGPGRRGLCSSLGARPGNGVALQARWLMARTQRWKRFALPLYLAAVLAATSLLLWLLLGHHALQGPAWLVLPVIVLMLFPASETAVAILNRLVCESVRPVCLPRLALASGIPPEHRVLVVMPAMLTQSATIHALARQLELHYLANPERCAQFALLTDWADASQQGTAHDDSLLACATGLIAGLNGRYPQPGADGPAVARFLVLHRERIFSPTEQCWIGWERKRGKLEQLVDALSGSNTSPFVDLGDLSRLAPNTPYIVTLDSDTQLPPGRLRELVGVAAHPQNAPRLDASGLLVVAGYGVLQPRISTPLPVAADFTLFQWLFAGQCGNDPYSAASSEVYQDLFGEGSFTGKGLLNVRAMRAVLSGRLPAGQVLSHDLLEGSLARCAAVTDVTLLEDAPVHADVAAARVHRWTRGDWQLLPFLLQPRRFPMAAVNRWKMFDNLRRSLVAPASLLLLLLSLFGLAGSPWGVLALLLAAASGGPLMGALAGLSPRREDLARVHFYRLAAIDLLRAAAGGGWLLAMLLHQSVWAVDAVARSAWRLAVSRRHLLQWTTADASRAAAQTRLPGLVRQHWRVTAAAVVLLAGFVLGAVAARLPHPLLAYLLCLLWGASPIWTWWVSRTCPVQDDVITPASRTYLQDVARDTWRLFERCVVADEHHLPPDNLQVTPHDMVAHRTSPTNIGLYLLSVACARQFGWIGTQDLLARMGATLATLRQLQRHRGHFLNWYDTQSLAPLMPMYVSTVDSGNLSAHLISVAQACREIAAAPYSNQAAHRAGAACANRLAGLAPESEAHAWCQADSLAMARSAALDAEACAVPAGDGESPELAAVSRMLALAVAFEELAGEANFSFLYHRKRNLFHIGYRVAEQELDAGFYDLLASESRLTSLLAIAKGDVPVRHWASLGRSFFAVGRFAGLRSWSGSMFEYLMPTLVLAEPRGSVLHDACEAALREQMAFAQLHRVPWGISESCYAASDHTLAFQYSPQGVPRLALRRTPPDELVIAPYATALAAQLAPELAVRNFAALEALSARGRYGFIEALDFTPARQADGGRATSVASYMAHHHGMTIVALANVLLEGVAQRWGMANAHMAAVASLMHERAPRGVGQLRMPAGAQAQALTRQRAPGLLRDVAPGAGAVEPTHVLSNGRYSVTLRANGAGRSNWGQVGITRRRDDALRDDHGSFFFLRWDQQPRAVSITQHPAPDRAADYTCTYHADRVCFDALWPRVQAHTTVWVSPEDDIEFRQVELRNLGNRTLDVELISALEVTLSDPVADEAHPAFANLFVRAAWHAAHQALVFERTPRLATDPSLQMAHFLAEADAEVVSLRSQTDRQRWRGRNGSASQPMADLDPAPTRDAQLQTGLDPVCALGVRVRIAPYGKARLTFATAVADKGGTLRAIIDKYRQASLIQRASLMSATLTGIRLRALRIGPATFSDIQLLTTALEFCLTRPPLAASPGESAPYVPCDRQLLWRFGISGDRPIILVSVGATQGLGLLRSLCQGLRLWGWGGIACDLVVINREPASYLMTLQQGVTALRDAHLADTAAEPNHGAAPATAFHVLRADEISSAELDAFQALARVHLHADGRPLLFHVKEWSEQHELAREQRHSISTTALQALPAAEPDRPPPVGQFDSPTGEFRFAAGARERTLRPWINVMANPEFGAQISEAGGGYTWAVNSQLNQLTAWSNDPVADPPSEWLVLQDLKTLQIWSLAPCPWGDASLAYRVSHGQGYTVISHRRGDLDITATWCVDPASAVKQVRVTVLNRGHHSTPLRLMAMAEWMMGGRRSDRRLTHTELYRQRLAAPDGPDAGTGQKLTALLCTQCDRAGGFGGGTAFFALVSPGGTDDDWTCDRRECFDARGQPVWPDHLGKQQGAGLDPCAALATPMTVLAGGAVERVLLLGWAADPDAACALATRAANVPGVARLEAVRASWDALLGHVTVRTPDPLFDILVNRWLLYQAVSCRLWSKAGFYQAGGATGYRDQLQDAMALAFADPDVLRRQVLLCASRQFPEGDVQHWWHAPKGAGIRTHFSDDLLWLPYACGHYLRATARTEVLDELVYFLEGAPIAPGAEDAYYTPTISDERATLFEHAARAIDHSLRVGAHGLPLMGSGDWNDGMNRVGIEGRGESVWLGWFLCGIVRDWAPIARARGETDRADRWDAASRGWAHALGSDAWDGEWFRRAFFDNGQPLGSHVNAQAQIDLIAQAWAVLSGVATPERQQQALVCMDQRLVDPAMGLIKLLDPPLTDAEPSAGYIQAYPPGVRENGGQYAHGAVWALMAQARLATGPNAGKLTAEQGDAAYRYFCYLSPAHRASNPAYGAVYGLEPYVMAGDVYSQPPYAGRGGWSWYTGAAAWMHRAAVESIFGLTRGATSLSFAPCLPSHWPQADITLQRDGRSMHFTLCRVAPEAAAAMATAQGAQVLLPREALVWNALPDGSRFLVPLPVAPESAEYPDESATQTAIPH